MTPLEEFRGQVQSALFEQDKSRTWLASKLGISETSLSNLLNGMTVERTYAKRLRNKPDANHAAEIVRLLHLDLALFEAALPEAALPEESRGGE